jgi:hypothetical protein
MHHSRRDITELLWETGRHQYRQTLKLARPSRSGLGSIGKICEAREKEDGEEFDVPKEQESVVGRFCRIPPGPDWASWWPVSARFKAIVFVSFLLRVPGLQVVHYFLSFSFLSFS